jgi:AcrR family transcriptional regulator
VRGRGKGLRHDRSESVLLPTLASPASSKRRGSTTEENSPTSEVIYEAVVALMYDRGYHGTSVRDVARAAGIQMASVYYHFPSKQALLMEVMSRTMRDLTAVTQSAAAMAGGDPVDRLTAVVRAHIIFHAERRKEAFLADSELRSLEAEQRTAVNGLRDRHEALFREILEQGIGSGQFTTMDLRLALNALLAMCTEVAVWYRPGGRLTLEQIARSYTSLFLFGVLSPDASNELNRRVPTGELGGA